MSSCNSATFADVQANEGPPSKRGNLRALCKSRPLISTFPSSLNWRQRSLRSAMRPNRVRSAGTTLGHPCGSSHACAGPARG
jgi:hypothetical protein